MHDYQRIQLRNASIGTVLQDVYQQGNCRCHKKHRSSCGAICRKQKQSQWNAWQCLAAGAKEPREPQDHGFMYGRSIEDLDGHIWEIFWMDSNAIKKSW